MATDVVMPQMGESVAEGTIVRWIKKVGDTVDRDEPLFEISTDKVDAEIPSPAAGVVAQIRVKEGETVAVNSVVAVIEAAGAKSTAKSPTPPPSTEPQQGSAGASAVQDRAAKEPPKAQPQADGAGAVAAPATSLEPKPAEPKPAEPKRAEVTPQAAPSTPHTEDHQRSSPLVRRIAKEHNVDIANIRGSGTGGRVTKEDILAFIEEQQPQASAPSSAPSATATSAPATQSARAVSEPPKFAADADTEAVPMSVMRKKIAEHMIASRRTSAHVHSMFEVNFGRVAQIRAKKKAEYERAGGKLTFLSFIMKAAVDAARAVPVVNASIDGENIVYHKHVNLGIAVALDWGLIVPVIKHAEEQNLLGLTKSIADLAERARTKRLKPDEVSGGTFTITNPGVFGALLGTPIINQPQVAILGVGLIEKRPVVIDDAIAIRPMAYLTLGYDHRIIDGAVADQFMSHLKNALENWDPGAA
jgi:pyruvate dehydrogenase E2 component (dihydrolipoamide acetyltransferase)